MKPQHHHDIVLSTLNARYTHTSFGLRYLLANLRELRSSATILEFTIQSKPLDVVAAILESNPKIVGLGVYIWNVTQTTEVASILKTLRPDITLILGGPEVSHETETQPITQWADYIICGEADIAFYTTCKHLLHTHEPHNLPKIQHADPIRFNDLTLPYDLYSDDDIQNRVIYVEASRGCPFRCEFCLSSLPGAVRKPDLHTFLDAMETLFQRGVRQFKFVDRTFNLDIQFSIEILNFFLKKHPNPDLFVHFEMIPDRLPAKLREPISQFPSGSLQFEVGIQTFNDDVAKRIKRRNNIPKLRDNFHFLRTETGVHIHADLIAGLPGEDLDSFAQGFDQLIALQPQEIQVGVLKRLRGTPIVRHDDAWSMRYSPHPPYEILENASIPFYDLQRIRRFSQLWDRVANSGHFPKTLPLLWHDASPFEAFMGFADFVYAETGRTHSLGLLQLAQLLLAWALEHTALDPSDIAQHLAEDYMRQNRKNLPKFIRQHLAEPVGEAAPAQERSKHMQARQKRHEYEAARK